MLPSWAKSLNGCEELGKQLMLLLLLLLHLSAAHLIVQSNPAGGLTIK